MRSVLFALAVAAIAAASCCGQSIEGPSEVEAGKPVWLSIAGVPDTTTSTFFPSDQLDVSPDKIKSGNALFWTPAAGTYSVTAIIVDWQNRTLVPLTKSIEVTGEGPDPDPFRNPYPEPPPEWRGPLSSILQSGPPKPYAIDRASRFNRFAESVRRGDVSTVGKLWELMAAERANGSHPSTKTAVASVLEQYLGRTDLPLSQIEHAETMLQAIAWAIWESAHNGT